MRDHPIAMAVETIDTPGDPRLAPYRDLRTRGAGRRDGLFVAESREVVRQLLAGTRFRVHSVLLTPAGHASLAAAVDRRRETPCYGAGENGARTSQIGDWVPLFPGPRAQTRKR